MIVGKISHNGNFARIRKGKIMETQNIAVAIPATNTDTSANGVIFKSPLTPTGELMSPEEYYRYEDIAVAHALAIAEDNERTIAHIKTDELKKRLQKLIPVSTGKYSVVWGINSFQLIDEKIFGWSVSLPYDEQLCNLFERLVSVTITHVVIDGTTCKETMLLSLGYVLAAGIGGMKELLGTGYLVKKSISKNEDGKEIIVNNNTQEGFYNVLSAIKEGFLSVGGYLAAQRIGQGLDEKLAELSLEKQVALLKTMLMNAKK